MRRLISDLPKFRGKQRLLQLLDRVLGNAILRARNNIKIEGAYSSIQDMAFLRREPENSALEIALKSLPPDGVFIDIGANCGYYSSYAAQLLDADGYVISIEPSSREYRRLIFAHLANGGECNWITLNMAAGASQSLVRLRIDCGHTGTNHITSDSLGRTQPCVAITLDTLVSWVLPDEKVVDLVKIDVEGYEYHVLQGMLGLLTKKRIAKLCVEVTDLFLRRSGSSKDLLFKFMEAHGYAPTVNSNSWQYDEIFVVKH